jgi:hypothetical protein
MSMVMGKPLSTVTEATPASDNFAYIRETAVPVKFQLAVAPVVLVYIAFPPW